MTVFRDEFNVMFLGLFAFLLYIKIFHWIVQDRVDMMEQATNIDWKFHTKMLTIMFFLLFMDVLGTWGAVLYTYHQGPSMMIIFGFEVGLLLLLSMVILCFELTKPLLNISSLQFSFRKLSRRLRNTVYTRSIYKVKNHGKTNPCTFSTSISLSISSN